MSTRDNVFEAAVAKAAKHQWDMVIASSSGKSALALLEACKKADYHPKVAVVRLVSSAAQNGMNRMTPEMKQELEAAGAVVVTAGHALSGAERGLSGRFKGVYPVEIMANTLRTFGQGTKVCFECAVMALDADAIVYGKPVVALAGTGGGTDTALVITPSYSATVLDTKIHEIIVKPDFY